MFISFHSRRQLAGARFSRLSSRERHRVVDGAPLHREGSPCSQKTYPMQPEVSRCPSLGSPSGQATSSPSFRDTLFLPLSSTLAPPSGPAAARISPLLLSAPDPLLVPGPPQLKAGCSAMSLMSGVFVSMTSLGTAPASSKWCFSVILSHLSGGRLLGQDPHVPYPGS